MLFTKQLIHISACYWVVPLVPRFSNFSFPISSSIAAQLEEFFKYINKIDYTEKPDYAKIKKWFCDALKNIGHADDGKSVYFAKSSTEKKGPGLKVANGSTKKVF